jgi:hypothetical protein
MNMTTIAQFLFICMIYLFFNLVSLSLSLSYDSLTTCAFVSVREKTGSTVTVGFRFFCSDLLSGVGLPPKKTGSQPYQSTVVNAITSFGSMVLISSLFYNIH